jgi:predicted CXXCH cytochrome family protein
MAGWKHLAFAVALCASASAGAAFAAGKPRSLAPLAASEAVSTHGPFEMGACEVCHEKGADARVPGRVVKASNELCFDCHDEFKKAVKHHPAVKSVCIDCHSPHNSKKKKLLL